jgi:hypothetical protein
MCTGNPFGVVSVVTDTHRAPKFTNQPTRAWVRSLHAISKCDAKPPQQAAKIPESRWVYFCLSVQQEFNMLSWQVFGNFPSAATNLDGF